MSTTTVFNTLKNANGVALVNALVTVELVTPSFDATGQFEVVRSAITHTDTSGHYTLSLTPNAEYELAGTYYKVTERDVVRQVTVLASDTPVWLGDLPQVEPPPTPAGAVYLRADAPQTLSDAQIAQLKSNGHITDGSAFAIPPVDPAHPFADGAAALEFNGPAIPITNNMTIPWDTVYQADGLTVTTGGISLPKDALVQVTFAGSLNGPVAKPINPYITGTVNNAAVSLFIPADLSTPLLGSWGIGGTCVVRAGHLINMQIQCDTAETAQLSYLLMTVLPILT